MLYRLVLMASLLAGALLLPVSAAQAERRVAFVVGNSNYQHTTALRNPANDAGDMAEALKKLGFDVLVGLDLDQQSFAAKVEQFAQLLDGADVGLFYYAGHGLQINERNYLVSVNARLANEFLVTSETIDLESIVRLMESKTAVNLVFLDACRNNPLTDNLKRNLASMKRSAVLGRGLARVDASGRDTLIAFAAAPGQEAADGGERNSPFTAALLRNITKPGLEVSVMLKDVAAEVRRDTRNVQRPQQLSDMTRTFYFVNYEDRATSRPEASAPAGRPAGATVVANAEDRALEVAFWNAAQAANECEAVRAYLQSFPNGIFVSLAKLSERRLCTAERPATAGGSPATPPKPAPSGPNTQVASAPPSAGPPPSSPAANPPPQAGSNAAPSGAAPVSAPRASPPPGAAPPTTSPPGSGRPSGTPTAAAPPATTPDIRPRPPAPATGQDRPQTQPAPQTPPSPAPSAQPGAPPAGQAPPGQQVMVRPTPLPSPPKGRNQMDSFRDCEQCPGMINLPGGAFAMGSNDDRSERPIHQVTVGPFALSRFPVTVREWKECLAAKACSYEASGDDDMPVHNVSWNDAQQYVAWLSKVTQETYRLPTEAEWEYAARADTPTKYWWGNQLVAGKANCKGCGDPYDPNRPTRVDAFAPNPFGLYGMTGGVFQWVSDCWHKDYQGAPANGSSWDAANCREHVLRGGSWKNDPSYIRASSRNYYDTGVRYLTHGFRVARSPRRAN